MRKSKSEETSRLLKKDPDDVPPPPHLYFSAQNVQQKQPAPPSNPGGDDESEYTYYTTSTAGEESRKSSYVTIAEKSEGAIGSPSTREIETQTLKDKAIPPPAPPIHHSIIGIGFTIICAVALSCASFLVKFLHERHEVPPANSIFWRAPLVLGISTVWLVQILCCSDGSANSDWNLVKRVLWPPTKIGRFKIIGILILSRVILGPVSIVTQFYSLEYIDLGDSNTIIFAAAVFVPIFAYCFLKEAWGVVPFFAALLTAIGVMIISKPQFLTGQPAEKSGGQRYLGFIYAMLSMSCNIGVYITLRYLNEVPGVILVWIMSVCSTLLGLILSFVIEGFTVPKDSVAFSGVIALMLTTAIGQFALVWALRYEEASMVSLIRCSELVFGFLWQMILGTYPDGWSGGGAIIVSISFGIVFFRKYLLQLPDDHQLRQHFKCLLK